MHAAYKGRGEIVDGFLARPLSNDPTAAVVLLHGYRGLDDAHKAITRKFAKEGFVCLSPDLFDGKISNDPGVSALLKISLDIDRAVERDQNVPGGPRLIPKEVRNPRVRGRWARVP